LAHDYLLYLFSVRRIYNKKKFKENQQKFALEKEPQSLPTCCTASQPAALLAKTLFKTNQHGLGRLGMNLSNFVPAMVVF
jgi:hypothetical protein